MASLTAVLITLSLIALDAAAGAATPTNWIERDGLRFAARIDLGPVPTGVPISASLHLENRSSGMVWIESLSPTCGCTIASWEADFLSPGEVRTPGFELEAYDHPGHYRHTVQIVSDPGRLAGEVIITADAQPSPTQTREFVLLESALEIGLHRSGEQLSTYFTVDNPGSVPRELQWSVWQHGEVIARSARPVRLPAQAQHVERVELLVSDDLWGAHLRVTGDEAAEEIPVRGHWQLFPSAPSRPVLLGDLEITGAQELDTGLDVDFGSLALGTGGLRTVHLRNTSDAPMRIDRIFTSARGELEIDYETEMLRAGESTAISIRYLGTRRPGSFRSFVHVVAAGQPPLRLSCRGFVQQAAAGRVDEAVRTFTVSVVRGDAFEVSLHDADGQSILEARTLDHADYALSLRKSGTTSDAICSNCIPNSGPTPRHRASAAHGELTLAVYSVLGDETFDVAHSSVLAWMNDPNGTVIQAIHASTDEAGGWTTPAELPVVVFHDDWPLVEEAARRTRVPAVFVVAGAAGSEPSVRSLRDVILFAPGSTRAAELKTSAVLTLHSKDHRILDWKLVEREQS